MTQKEIEGIIKIMQVKTCKSDILPSKLIRNNLEFFVPIITKVVNISLCEGVFADRWKLATLCPVLKKAGWELICGNYRHVSNLDYISEIIEWAMMLQLKNHIKLKQCWKSTSICLQEKLQLWNFTLRLVIDLMWSMEKRELNGLVSVDFSAAFNTVDHNILLDMLKTNLE